MKLMKVTMLVKLLLTSKRLLTQLGGGGGGGGVCFFGGNNNKKSGFETIINGILVFGHLFKKFIFCF